jgi:hypothetical protein
VGTLVLLLTVVAIAGSATLVASCLRLSSAVSFLLAAFLLGSAEIVAISLLLSPGGWLTRGSFSACVAVVAVVAFFLWVGLGRPRPPLSSALLRRGREALSDPAVAVLATVVLLVYAYLLLVALTVPQSVPDTMLYHLPRAAFWKQQHGVAPVSASPDDRINVFPPNAEIEMAVSMILSRGDRFVGIVQILSVIATVVAIAGIARRLGYTARQSMFGALAFASLPVVVLQAPTALNDLAVMGYLVIAAYFAMGPTKRELALGALALALAEGTKGTMVFALPALALFALATQPFRRWLELALFGLAGLVAGSYWYIVNVSATGGATGGQNLDRGSSQLLERFARTIGDLVEVSNGDGASLLAYPWWTAVAFFLCAVGAVLVTAHLRRATVWWTIFAVVIAALSASLIVTWLRVGYRVVLHVLAVLGISTPSTSRLPEGYYESPMHSSYGLAFVLLFAAAIVLVVRDAIRGGRAWPAIAALGAVPLTLFVTSFFLAYDTMRMRYVVFGVALAAAVFGAALRIRPVVWIATTLACVNAAVLVVYFIPRPAGLTLLGGNRELDTAARWFAQGNSGNGDPEAFRFLEEEVPADTTVALSLVQNTYVYPAWDAGLRRTVVFVPADGAIPPQADWLVVGPRDDFHRASLPPPALETAKGWRIYRLRSAH